MHRRARLALLWTALAAFGIGACASTAGPPSNVADACALADERTEWYEAARAASAKWNAPTATILAIIWRESRFQASARPPRTYALGVIPTGRQSSAYGFPQAIDGTWEWYRSAAGAPDADRNDFADAADFVGWYMSQTVRRTGVPMHDAMGHYIAYHEGHGGFRSGAWRKKLGVTRAAHQVAVQAAKYDRQLRACDPAYANA